MVGHDLNRGTSAFRRRPRLSSTDSREAEEAPPATRWRRQGSARNAAQAAQAA